MDTTDKDQLIKTQQKELEELRQKQRDFNEVSYLVNNLEYKYEQLEREKSRIENEYEKRIQRYIKENQTLRSQH